MNTRQSLDVPRGADNYLETDYPGLDLSAVNLPTHFDPLPPRYRHVFCAFSYHGARGFQRQQSDYLVPEFKPFRVERSG